MKINLLYELKGFDGNVLKDEAGEIFTIGKTLSNILVRMNPQSKHLDTLKAYILAQKFYTEKECDIDDSDMNKLKAAIEATEIYTPLITGQILQYFNSIKE